MTTTPAHRASARAPRKAPRGSTGRASDPVMAVPAFGVLRALGLGLSVGLLFLVAGMAVILIVVPKATGSTPLTVLTQSMEPRLPPGTLLVVRPEPVSRIRVGDVVTYQIVSGQPAVISHRVVSITSDSRGERTFILKGDNNATADPKPVKPVQVRGVLWYSIPKIGWVNQLVNGYARSWIIPALAGVLFLYAAVMIVLGTVTSVRRRRTKAQASGAEPSRPSIGA
jgi:signal peptidase